MDFSNPTVLANAMIFHDNMVNLQNLQNTYNPPSTSLSSPYYIPPMLYNSSTSSEYQSFPTCGSAVSEYPYPEPIKDTLNAPYTLEDAILGREYLRIVMGMFEESTLIVSIFLNRPKTNQFESVKLFIKERIIEFMTSDIDSVLLVISGDFSEEFKKKIKQFFIHKKYIYEEVSNKIILKRDKKK